MTVHELSEKLNDCCPDAIVGLAHETQGMFHDTIKIELFTAKDKDARPEDGVYVLHTFKPEERSTTAIHR